MQSTRVERQIGGQTLSIETGTLAKLADGSVTVRMGDTVVLGAVVRANPREGIDFFPLQVDYRERRAAAGKFPGGFIKREGRPTTKEVLTARLVDRPLRPLFPKGFMDEVQIHLTLLSADLKNDPDMLAGIAASAAVVISDVPLTHPIGHVRVGRIDGQFVLFPTQDVMEQSDLDLVVAGTRHFVNMIEVGSREVKEDELADAIEFGHKAVIDIVSMIEELQKKVGKEKVGEAKQHDPGFVDAIRARVSDKIRKIKGGKGGKQDRSDAVKQVLEDLLTEMAPQVTDPKATYMSVVAQKDEAKKIRKVFSEVEEQATREAILAGVRPDGRGYNDIRPLDCQVGVLPRVHGSAVFTRGETQALCTVTLGTSSDEQLVEGATEEYSQKFMLHYYFPSYSVGEVRPIRGPGRREIGHGALAERSLIAVLPPVDKFPYTVRIISDILESNGSSSMASACGGCLALMDAGVPISKPVAGISVGLVQENGKQVLLTDIIGEEDHYGDMDFKVVGTRDGITAVQLDIKTEGLDYKIIRQTLHRAKEARLKILEAMAKAIPAPRAEISQWAPRLLTIKIDPEKIGKIIGPGGKNIKALQADTGAHIDIEDDGTVYISAVDGAAAERCRDIIEAMTAEVKVGRIYAGRVVSIKDFGAFIEIAPETDGLCHVSELSDQYVDRVTDVIQMGDEVRVKVILVDDQGRIKLSRKAAMLEEGNTDADPNAEPAGAPAASAARARARDEVVDVDEVETIGNRADEMPGDRPRGGGGDRGGDRGPRRDGGGDRGPRRDGGGGGGGDRGPRTGGGGGGGERSRTGGGGGDRGPRSGGGGGDRGGDRGPRPSGGGNVGGGGGGGGGRRPPRDGD